MKKYSFNAPKKLEDIVLLDRALPIKLNFRRGARHLILRIEAGGRALRVSAPLGMGLHAIENFILCKKSWIEQELQRIAPTYSEHFIHYGDLFPFLDIPHKILYAPQQKTPILLHKDKKEITLSCPPEDIGAYMGLFLKQQAKNYIPILADEYCRQLKCHYNAISYKDTKSCWGSCSYAKNLSFSWRIMMAPESVLHYLVAHEVTHLIEMNHSADFWALCMQLCANAKKERKWLKIYGNQLHKYDFG